MDVDVIPNFLFFFFFFFYSSNFYSAFYFIFPCKRHGLEKASNFLDDNDE